MILCNLLPSEATQPELVSNDLWEQRVRLLREQERDDKVLLPAHVVPLKYRVTIRPDLDTFTFNGTETVEVDSQLASAGAHAARAEHNFLRC